MPKFLIGRSTDILHLENGAGISFEQYGTTLRIIGAGGVGFMHIVQDLGVAHRDGTFDITGLTGLTPGRVVLVQHTAAPVPSKGGAQDEPEMDFVQAVGYVLNATTIRVRWQAPSIVVGDVALAYVVALS
jgi:hypothetical protein